MSTSFSGSANAVASSSTTIGASFKIARAIMSRCTSPPDRCAPAAPYIVSAPSGILAMMSSHCAAASAASASSRDASGRAARTFSSSVWRKSRFVWNTNATRSMRSCGSMSRTSTPPTRTLPASTSQKRGTSAAVVDLPPPEGPTSATVEPAGTAKLTSESAGASAPS